MYPMKKHQVYTIIKCITFWSCVLPTNTKHLFETIKLRVALISVPPYSAKGKDGSFTGFNIDLLQEIRRIAKKKYKVRFQYEFEEIEPHYIGGLNYIANDCKIDCDKFDVIVGDYFSSPERFERVDFTPSWLRSSISTVKNLKSNRRTYDTLGELEAANGTVCLFNGTMIVPLTMEQYPNATYLICESTAACIEKVKNDECDLFADDELPIRYVTRDEQWLEVNVDSFATQYLVWPMNYNLDFKVSHLFKKCMYEANKNQFIDGIYNKYFEFNRCPIGSSGEKCEKPCDRRYGRADRFGNCVCDSTRWTGDDCSVEVHQNFNYLPNYLRIIASSMFAFTLLLIIVCLVFLRKHRHSALIRSNDIVFLCMVLLGCFVSNTSLLTLAFEDDRLFSSRIIAAFCNLSYWFYSIGFCITFSTLTVKIYWVYKIFEQSAQFRRINLSLNTNILTVGAVLLLGVSILTTMTMINPSVWTREVILEDKYGFALASVGSCKFRQSTSAISLMPIFVYHLIILVVACCYCYLSRNIPSNYTFAKSLMHAILSYSQLFILGCPILLLMQNNPSVSFLGKCIFIWLTNVAVVGFIFGNIANSIFKNKDPTSLADAMSRFSTSRGKSGAAPVENSQQSTTEPLLTSSSTQD